MCFKFEKHILSVLSFKSVLLYIIPNIITCQCSCEPARYHKTHFYFLYLLLFEQNKLEKVAIANCDALQLEVSYIRRAALMMIIVKKT